MTGEPESEKAVTGSLDLSALEVSEVVETNFRVLWQGTEWIKVNYDTGASITALPVSFAEGLPLQQEGELVVASGHGIPNLGKMKVPMRGEDLKKCSPNQGF